MNIKFKALAITSCLIFKSIICDPIPTVSPNFEFYNKSIADVSITISNATDKYKKYKNEAVSVDVGKNLQLDVDPKSDTKIEFWENVGSLSGNCLRGVYRISASPDKLRYVTWRVATEKNRLTPQTGQTMGLSSKTASGLAYKKEYRLDQKNITEDKPYIDPRKSGQEKCPYKR